MVSAVTVTVNLARLLLDEGGLRICYVEMA